MLIAWRRVLVGPIAGLLRGIHHLSTLSKWNDVARAFFAGFGVDANAPAKRRLTTLAPEGVACHRERKTLSTRARQVSTSPSSTKGALKRAVLPGASELMASMLSPI